MNSLRSGTWTDTSKRDGPRQGLRTVPSAHRLRLPTPFSSFACLSSSSAFRLSVLPAPSSPLLFFLPHLLFLHFFNVPHRCFRNCSYFILHSSLCFVTWSRSIIFRFQSFSIRRYSSNAFMSGFSCRNASSRKGRAYCKSAAETCESYKKQKREKGERKR